jgi:Fe-S cluster assembly protein SufD
MKNNLKDYLDAVNVFSALKEEPAWMLELRQAALDKVDALPFPVIERVKYERWPLLNIDEAELNGENVVEGTIPSFDEMSDHPILVQKDGATVFEQLPQHLIDQGVIFTDLFTAMQEHSDLVKEYYMTKAVPVDEDKMTAAHAAFMNGGMFLYVPKMLSLKNQSKLFSIIMAMQQHISSNMC